MNTKLSILCDKFIEAGWLAGLILTPLYMNIYTHRMFEPDKATIVRCLAILMLAFYITKLVDNAITRYRSPETPPPQDKPSIWLHFIKTPLFISFGAFVFAYIVSVIFSAVPYNSIWGGYDRMQGLYTSAGYWVIFLLVALNLRTKAQIDRIVTTIIFTSIPIVVYAFIQKFGMDPIPFQNFDFTATLGNSEFLGGYLILVIPFIVSRLINSIADKRILTSVFYGILILLQIIIVSLTKSRILIFTTFVSISACILIYAIIRRRKGLIALNICTLMIGITFIILSGLINFESFQKLPDDNKIKTLWYNTFGKMINSSYYSGCFPPLKPDADYELNFRVALCKGIWKLICDKDKLYRFFIGYGPETIHTIYHKNRKNYLMDIYSDRSHNGYLDVWVWHGVIGLAAYLFIIGYLIYLAIKTIRLKPSPNQNAPPDDIYFNTITIGFFSTLIIYIVHSFVSVTSTVVFNYFWIIAAVIYAMYRLKSLPRLGENVQNEEKSPEAIKHETPNTFNWKTYPYPYIVYIIITIIITFVMFSLSWPATRIITPEVKTVRDALLVIFCFWLLTGNIMGIVAWPRWLFWTYAGQTILLAVIMVRRYWPDDTTNTDLLMIYSWAWLLLGLIIGALSINDTRKTMKWGNPEGVMAGIVTLAAALFVIITVNLPVLRADGFYKFCFSYDQSAEDVIRSGEYSADEARRAGDQEGSDRIRQAKRYEAYQIRLMCIKHFQSALRFAPDERAYLNGIGRNFLELAKLVIALKKDNLPVNKLTTPPTIKQIIEMDKSQFDNFSQHDFVLCCVTCIQRAYELDPRNYERLIAMIRIHRYWGDLDKDKTTYEKALKLCDEARQASPQNTKTDDEIRELQQRLKQY